MKRKIWRSGNSLVITIPSEVVDRMKLMEKKLVDFDIRDVFEETEKMFDNMFGEDMFLQPRQSKGDLFRQPLMDLKETGNEFIASIEIPGVDKNDIQLNITEDHLEIKVEKKSEIKVEHEEQGYLRSERIFNGFYRSMSLPSRIITQKARASYKNGILEVTMPKAQQINPLGKRISIE